MFLPGSMPGPSSKNALERNYSFLYSTLEYDGT